MCQERRHGPPDGLIPHPCRPAAEPETDARPEAEADEDREAGRDPAVEAYVAHRRSELQEALEDPFSPVTGPVRDPGSTGIATGSSRGTSWENLEAQLVGCSVRRRLSLDGVWRAVGSPAGKGPLEWIALARPMVPAFNRYFENLAACGYHEKSKHRSYLFIEEGDLDDDHRAGDVTTPLWLIAEAYASFLDSVTSSDE